MGLWPSITGGKSTAFMAGDQEQCLDFFGDSVPPAKLEEPSRELPTDLGIDPRDLSAYDHFLQVSRRILHHHQVAFVLPTPP